ncbi:MULTISPECIES: hypothetical protein [Herpetosiphon]|uniref:hypothetical protein n=1 Tax=Herpetosiphon TaxID=64 RepID=UPI00195D5801|nr:hypothetical protein [Herpetosiphon giganteus]MBM7842490.1 hypothetical protein [Herpetosiphon giganteus]
MILQEFARYHSHYFFDPDDAILAPLKISNPRAIDGLISMGPGSAVVFYRTPRGLFLRLNRRELQISDATSADVIRGETNTLIVYEHVYERLRWNYTPPAWIAPLIPNDNASLDEEHFDFGVFIYNVLSNKQRKRLVFARK